MDKVAVNEIGYQIKYNECHTYGLTEIDEFLKIKTQIVTSYVAKMPHIEGVPIDNCIAKTNNQFASENLLISALN